MLLVLLRSPAILTGTKKVTLQLPSLLTSRRWFAPEILQRSHASGARVPYGSFPKYGNPNIYSPYYGTLKRYPEFEKPYIGQVQRTTDFGGSAEHKLRETSAEEYLNGTLVHLKRWDSRFSKTRSMIL